jgi:hypothetical protein
VVTPFFGKGAHRECQHTGHDHKGDNRVPAIS